MLVSILGALSLAIYGTKLVGESLKKVTHKTVSHFFEFIDDSHFIAVFTGFFVTTTLVQSSLDVVTMVFSFVNSGILQVSQAIGIMIGADIGATLCGWVISLFILNKNLLSGYILGFIATGFILILFEKNKSINILGEFIFGVGFLLLGLMFLLNRLDYYSYIFHRFKVEELGIVYFWGGIFFASILISFFLRSTWAGIIIAMTLLYANYFSLKQAMVMVLGLHVGVAIRPFISGLRMGQALTQQVALLYMGFKLLIVVFVVCFFNIIFEYFDTLIRENFGKLITLSFYNTLLACLNLVFFLPLNFIFKYYGSCILDKNVDIFSHGRYRLKYDKRVVSEVPEIALAMAKKEIINMTELIEKMANDYQYVFNNSDKNLRKIVCGIKEKEDLLDQMYIEITRFLIESSSSNLLVEHHANVNFFMRIVKELESAGDCIVRLTKLLQNCYKHKTHYGETAKLELKNYFNLALDFFHSIKNKLALNIQTEDFDQVTYTENCMNEERTRLRKKSENNLEKSGVNVRVEIMFMEQVRHIERLGDCCMNLAEAIRNLK